MVTTGGTALRISAPVTVAPADKVMAEFALPMLLMVVPAGIPYPVTLAPMASPARLLRP